MTRDKLQVLHATGLFTAVEARFLITLAELASFVDVVAGDLVVRQGEPSTSMYIVERGVFEVTSEGELGRQTIGEIHPGELIGEVQLLTGGARMATVHARTPGRLLELDKPAFDDLAAEHPDLLARIIEIVNQRLLRRQLLRALTAAFGSAGTELARSIADDPAWVRLQRGEVLVETGEFGDQAFLVVSGELLILSDQEERAVFGTISTGELVGEFALVKSGVRSATVVAARESWLVSISGARFRAASVERPELFANLVEVVINRVRTRGSARPQRQTIALLPLSSSVPIESIVRDLQPALERVGACARLSATDAVNEGLLRRPRQLAVDSPAWMRLTLWLQMRRRDADFVLLIGDSEDTPWTQRIIAEADHLVLVADPRQSSELTVVDAVVARASHQAAWEARVWLLVAHPADTRAPTGTAKWLSPREVEQHVHVRVGDPGDTARLARMLSGRAIGMALSGGGARGFAHIGVYQAWCEAGLPIDCFAGTSAGAFLGGLMAMGSSPEELTRRVEAAFASAANPFGDVTLPMISLIRGRRIRELLERTYGDVYIEDLWRPFTATCTNLTRGVGESLDRGSLWRALLASGSPPAITPPVIIDGDLYCDGGLTDNLPVSALDQAACGVRVASYIGTDSGLSPTVADSLPSPWAFAWDRLFRGGARTSGLPNIAEVVMRAMTLTDARQIADARARADVFFEPPVSSIDMFDFSRPLLSIQSSYRYAQQLIADHERVEALREKI